MFPWQQTQNNSIFLTILTIILDFRSKLHKKQYFIQNIGTTINPFYTGTPSGTYLWITEIFPVGKKKSATAAVMSKELNLNDYILSKTYKNYIPSCRKLNFLQGGISIKQLGMHCKVIEQ